MPTHLDSADDYCGVVACYLASVAFAGELAALASGDHDGLMQICFVGGWGCLDSCRLARGAGVAEGGL